MTKVLRWLPLVSAVCQLVGTALIVWGLSVVSNPLALTFMRDRKPGEVAPPPLPPAAIAREHEWAVTWGIWLLLAGLALQVGVTIRDEWKRRRA